MEKWEIFFSFAYLSAVWLQFWQNPVQKSRLQWFQLDFAQIVTKQLIDKQNWKIFLISPNTKYCFFSFISCIASEANYLLQFTHFTYEKGPKIKHHFFFFVEIFLKMSPLYCKIVWWLYKIRLTLKWVENISTHCCFPAMKNMLTHDSKHTHNKTHYTIVYKKAGISELRTMYICSTIISSRVIVDTNDFF